MAHIGINKLAGQTQKVRLLLDQIVLGTECKKGDTCDLPPADARHLVSIKRAEIFVEPVKPAAEDKGGK